MSETSARERFFLAVVRQVARQVPWVRLMAIVSRAWCEAEPQMGRLVGGRYAEQGRAAQAELAAAAQADPLFKGRWDAADFTPFAVESYGNLGLVVVQLHACPICRVSMVEASDQAARMFPRSSRDSLAEQLKRAGWRQMSKVRDPTSDTRVCQTCADEGKLTFVCALCGESRPSSESQEAFGSPAEHLCATCYATVPAREWDAKVEELEKSHKYDYM